ncbi:MAG: hypothetical protein JO108_25150 [Acidobacteriaceae bacterium]|nr:hypothetical protein [Acidobacteriaceae bacterium]
MNIRSGFVLLVLAISAQAADLKRETLAAWQSYIGAATGEMQERIRPGGRFLTLAEDREALSKVRNGEVVILHNSSNGMKKVPSGLIHDWSAAAFIPGATLRHVDSVMRDYDRYKEFYRPNVVDSRALSSEQAESRFSMILMNKSAVVNLAMDGDYRCDFFQVDERRSYTISETTRMQEIDNYGTASERELPDGRGKGLIWRLFSIARFEERDGGVYIELRAIALSRDIPLSLRWMVEPIVNRVSRNSVTTTLGQTETAVRSGATLAALRVDSARASQW